MSYHKTRENAVTFRNFAIIPPVRLPLNICCVQSKNMFLYYISDAIFSHFFEGNIPFRRGNNSFERYNAPRRAKTGTKDNITEQITSFSDARKAKTASLINIIYRLMYL